MKETTEKQQLIKEIDFLREIISNYIPELDLNNIIEHKHPNGTYSRTFIESNTERIRGLKLCLESHLEKLAKLSS